MPFHEVRQLNQDSNCIILFLNLIRLGVLRNTQGLKLALQEIVEQGKILKALQEKSCSNPPPVIPTIRTTTKPPTETTTTTTTTTTTRPKKGPNQMQLI